MPHAQRLVLLCRLFTLPAAQAPLDPSVAKVLHQVACSSLLDAKKRLRAPFVEVLGEVIKGVVVVGEELVTLGGGGGFFVSRAVAAWSSRTKLRHMQGLDAALETESVRV